MSSAPASPFPNDNEITVYRRTRQATSRRTQSADLGKAGSISGGADQPAMDIISNADSEEGGLTPKPATVASLSCVAPDDGEQVEPVESPTTENTPLDSQTATEGQSSGSVPLHRDISGQEIEKTGEDIGIQETAQVTTNESCEKLEVIKEETVIPRESGTPPNFDESSFIQQEQSLLLPEASIIPPEEIDPVGPTKEEFVTAVRESEISKEETAAHVEIVPNSPVPTKEEIGTAVRESEICNEQQSSANVEILQTTPRPVCSENAAIPKEDLFPLNTSQISATLPKDEIVSIPLTFENRENLKEEPVLAVDASESSQFPKEDNCQIPISKDGSVLVPDETLASSMCPFTEHIDVLNYETGSVLIEEDPATVLEQSTPPGSNFDDIGVSNDPIEEGVISKEAAAPTESSVESKEAAVPLYTAEETEQVSPAVLQEPTVSPDCTPDQIQILQLEKELVPVLVPLVSQTEAEISSISEPEKLTSSTEAIKIIEILKYESDKELVPALVPPVSQTVPAEILPNFEPETQTIKTIEIIKYESSSALFEEEPTAEKRTSPKQETPPGFIFYETEAALDDQATKSVISQEQTGPLGPQQETGTPVPQQATLIAVPEQTEVLQLEKELQQVPSASKTTDSQRPTASQIPKPTKVSTGIPATVVSTGAQIQNTRTVPMAAQYVQMEPVHAYLPDHLAFCHTESICSEHPSLATSSLGIEFNDQCSSRAGDAESIISDYGDTVAGIDQASTPAETAYSPYGQHDTTPTTPTIDPAYAGDQQREEIELTAGPSPAPTDTSFVSGVDFLITPQPEEFYDVDEDWHSTTPRPMEQGEHGAQRVSTPRPIVEQPQKSAVHERHIATPRPTGVSGGLSMQQPAPYYPHAFEQKDFIPTYKPPRATSSVGTPAVGSGVSVYKAPPPYSSSFRGPTFKTTQRPAIWTPTVGPIEASVYDVPSTQSRQYFQYTQVMPGYAPVPLDSDSVIQSSDQLQAAPETMSTDTPVPAPAPPPPPPPPPQSLGGRYLASVKAARAETEAEEAAIAADPNRSVVEYPEKQTVASLRSAIATKFNGTAPIKGYYPTSPSEAMPLKEQNLNMENAPEQITTFSSGSAPPQPAQQSYQVSNATRVVQDAASNLMSSVVGPYGQPLSVATSTGGPARWPSATPPARPPLPSGMQSPTPAGFTTQQSPTMSSSSLASSGLRFGGRPDNFARPYDRTSIRGTDNASNLGEHYSVPYREAQTVTRRRITRRGDGNYKYEDIGPMDSTGTPLGLREMVPAGDQHQWYKMMYKKMHQIGKKDDPAMVRYRVRDAVADRYFHERSPARRVGSSGGSSPQRAGYKFTEYLAECPPAEDEEPGSMDFEKPWTPKPFNIFEGNTTRVSRPVERDFYGHPNRSKSANRYEMKVAGVPPNSYSSGFPSYAQAPAAVPIQQFNQPSQYAYPAQSAQPYAPVSSATPQYEQEKRRMDILTQRPQSAGPFGGRGGVQEYAAADTMTYVKRELSPMRRDEARQWYHSVQTGGDAPPTGFRQPAPPRRESPPLYASTTINSNQMHSTNDKLDFDIEEFSRLEQELMQEEERRKRQLKELEDQKAKWKMYGTITPQFSPAVPQSQPQLSRFSPAIQPIQPPQFAPSAPQSQQPAFSPSVQSQQPDADLRGVAKALHNFVAHSSKEVSFRKGDLIKIHRKVDDNWYEGEVNGKVGILPRNYVDLAVTAQGDATAMLTEVSTSAEGTAQALFNFEGKNSNELPLIKGEYVVLTGKIDGNWWTGRNEFGRQGLFPASYVTILKQPAACSTDYVTAYTGVGQPQTFVRGDETPLKSLSNGPPPEINRTLPTVPPAPAPGADRIRLTAPPQQISDVSNNDLVWKARDLAKNVRKEFGSRHDSGAEMIDAALAAGPPDTFQAVFPYKPQNADELELKENDIVYVVEKCDDGWFIGTSLRSGRFGTFPGNYVKRL